MSVLKISNNKSRFTRHKPSCIQCGGSLSHKDQECDCGVFDEDQYCEYCLKKITPYDNEIIHVPHLNYVYHYRCADQDTSVCFVCFRAINYYTEENVTYSTEAGQSCHHGCEPFRKRRHLTCFGCKDILTPFSKNLSVLGSNFYFCPSCCPFSS